LCEEAETAGARLVNADPIPFDAAAEPQVHRDRASPREAPAGRVETDRARIVAGVGPVLVAGRVEHRYPYRRHRLPGLRDDGFVTVTVRGLKGWNTGSLQVSQPRDNFYHSAATIPRLSCRLGVGGGSLRVPVETDRA